MRHIFWLVGIPLMLGGKIRFVLEINELQAYSILCNYCVISYKYLTVNILKYVVAFIKAVWGGKCLQI